MGTKPVTSAQARIDRELLRHTLATLAYRASKAIRNAPDNFASFEASPQSRTPLEILGHMCDLLDWAHWLCQGEHKWAPVPVASWTLAVERFFAAAETLDRFLESDAPLGSSTEKIFQGPIADALTHTGQLAMLRGLVNSPLRPESYARAAIRAGSVGLHQPAPLAEFDGDASKPKT